MEDKPIPAAEEPSVLETVVTAEFVGPPYKPKPKIKFNGSDISEDTGLKLWVKVLTKHPEIKLVQINVQGLFKKNVAISRIKKIKEFLIKDGVTEDRMQEGGLIRSKTKTVVKIVILRIEG